MPTDLVSLLAFVQEPKGEKGKGDGPGCNYIVDLWFSEAALNLLDFSSVKDLTSLGPALSPTSSSLHYQLTVILDGVKIMVWYDSGAAFSMISWGLCNQAGFKVGL